MAVADMFLKLTGVTGESTDADHKGEIEVLSWSWGMQASVSAAAGATTAASGRPTIGELQIVKRADCSSPALMRFLVNHKLVSDGKLTVRRPGTTPPLEYLTIELEKVRVTSWKTESVGPDVIERMNLGFAKVTVTYTEQTAGGDKGKSNDFGFELDAK